jgi:hypothetical protein
MPLQKTEQSKRRIPKTPTINSDLKIATDACTATNTERLIAQYAILNEREKVVEAEIIKNRMAIASESRWRQLWEMVRDKLCPQRKFAEERLLQISDSSSPDYAAAKQNLDTWEAHCKTRLFISQVDKIVDRSIGLGDDQKHQLLVKENDSIKAQKEEIEAAIKMIREPGRKLSEIKCPSLPDMKFVITGNDLSRMMNGFITDEYKLKEELKLSLRIAKESIFKREYLLTDHNALREKSISEMYPELVKNRADLEGIKQSIEASKSTLASLTKTGLENKWTNDGSVSRFWPPKVFKSSNRLEWEQAVNAERESLKNKIGAQVETNKGIKKILEDINKNKPAIEQYMRDSFRPDYNKDNAYRDLVANLDRTDKTIKSALEVQKSACKLPANIIEVKSFNPAEIANDKGVKSKLKELENKILMDGKAPSKSHFVAEMN